MPRYRVKELSFIDNHLVQAGEEIEYDGVPADNLEPLDDAARAAAEAGKTANADSLARMKSAASDMTPTTPAGNTWAAAMQQITPQVGLIV